MRRFKQEKTEPQGSEHEALTMTEVSDEDLIRAIAARKLGAMDLLYQRYSRLLYSLAYRMVMDAQIAEDLIQETFLSVWRHAASYAPQSGIVRSWLISIVHHRAIDHLRSVRRRGGAANKVTLDDIENEESIAQPDVWDEAWLAIQGSQVRAALLELSKEQRRVIELAYFQGWTHSEISEGCHIPLGTVKARMRLGLLHLKSILLKMGVEGL